MKRPSDKEIARLLRDTKDALLSAALLLRKEATRDGTTYLRAEQMEDVALDSERHAERVYQAADALESTPAEPIPPNELMDILDQIDGDGVVVTDYELAIPALRSALGR